MVVAVIVGFTINVTVVAGDQETRLNITSQSNSSTALNSTSIRIGSEGKKIIIVTWLEANETKIDNTPTIRVSNEDFWKIFGPLLNLSTSGSTVFDIDSSSDN